MAKKITLKMAEADYNKQANKVEQLKAELKAAEDELRKKRTVYKELEKKEALDKISKALFKNDDISLNDVDEIVDFINMQNDDKAKKVVTNDN